MRSKKTYRKSPRAYEHEEFPWHIGRVPKTWNKGGGPVKHPARASAVFLVHGIGEQMRTETAAMLHSGFEDALDEIADWQRDHNIEGVEDIENLPPPYIHEGYWANYPNVKETFPEDCAGFADTDLEFFDKVWRIRILSAFRTYWWFIWQQIKLLFPTSISRVGFWAWLLPSWRVSLLSSWA